LVNSFEDIERGMTKKNIELQQKIEEIPELINEKALAEREFELAYAGEILRLKAEGYPITIIPKLASGSKQIADLKFNVAVKTELLKIQYAKIDALKIAINSYQSMHALRRIEYQKAHIQEG
jgi:hypothetical protein